MAVMWILVLYFTAAGVMGCDDRSPDRELNCRELITLGSSLCLEDFMIRYNYCSESCGRAPCPPKNLKLQGGSAVVLEGKRTGQKQFAIDLSTPSSSPPPPPSPSPLPVMVPPPAPPATHVPSPYPAQETQETQETSSAPVPMPEHITGSPSPDGVENSTFSPSPQPSTSPSPSSSPAVFVSEPAAGPFLPSAPETFLEATEPVADETEQDEALDTSQCQKPFDFLASRGDLSFFKQVIEKFGFSDSFSSPNFLVTAFVPNNDAFRHLLGVLGISEEDFLQGNKNVVQQLLQVHLVPGRVFMEEEGRTKRLQTQLSTRQELEIDGVLVTSPGGPKKSLLE